MGKKKQERESIETRWEPTKRRYPASHLKPLEPLFVVTKPPPIGCTPAEANQWRYEMTTALLIATAESVGPHNILGVRTIPSLIEGVVKCLTRRLDELAPDGATDRRGVDDLSEEELAAIADDGESPPSGD